MRLQQSSIFENFPTHLTRCWLIRSGEELNVNSIQRPSSLYSRFLLNEVTQVPDPNVSDEIILDQECRSAVIANESVFQIDEFVLDPNMLLKTATSCEELLAELSGRSELIRIFIAKIETYLAIERHVFLVKNCLRFLLRVTPTLP